MIAACHVGTAKCPQSATSAFITLRLPGDCPIPAVCSQFFAAYVLLPPICLVRAPETLARAPSRSDRDGDNIYPCLQNNTAGIRSERHAHELRHSRNARVLMRTAPSTVTRRLPAHRCAARRDSLQVFRMALRCLFLEATNLFPFVQSCSDQCSPPYDQRRRYSGPPPAGAAGGSPAATLHCSTPTRVTCTTRPRSQLIGDIAGTAARSPRICMTSGRSSGSRRNPKNLQTQSKILAGARCAASGHSGAQPRGQELPAT
jgi:hypothetical protein